MSRNEAALIALDRALSGDSLCTELDVRERYARDGSDAAPALPDAVVRVRRPEDVQAVLRVASEHGVPVTPRAGGTSRVGGAVPSPGGWVLALERMGAIKELDRREGLAIVEPGVITGELHRSAEAEGLFFPPDPGSAGSSMIGGNVGANAAGPRAFKYGPTGAYVLGLDAITGDGQRLRVGRRTRKGVTGYDLTSLLVGSEGTLAVATEITLKLLRRPEAVGTLLVLLDDPSRVAKLVEVVLALDVMPRCVELLDALTLTLMRRAGAGALPERARAMLLIELDGEPARVERELERLGGMLLDAGAFDVLCAQSEAEREKLWTARRQMSLALRGVARHKLSEDVVVPRTKLDELLVAVGRIGEARSVRMAAYGHAGDGNIHVNFLWDEADERARVEGAIGELFEVVIRLGGTLSGEHGIGLMKVPYLPLEQSEPLIEAQRRIKAVFDPKGILNPGKVLPPRRGHGAC